MSADKQPGSISTVVPANRYGAILLCCIALNTATAAYAGDDEPAATPYRPTVSNPADLSEPGWIEMEMGWQNIKGGSDKRRQSFPVLAKLAFTRNWGILLGNEMGVRRTDSSGALYSGSGDTTLTIKHRIPMQSDSSALGVEAGYKFATAKDSIGSGQPDYILNGIYSADFSNSHLDLNLGATHLGAIADGQGRYQYSWASSLSRNLNEQWGVFGEVSGTSQRGTLPQSQLLVGASYNVSKRIVVDAGGAFGLAKASQNWTIFTGITVLLGKLW